MKRESVSPSPAARTLALDLEGALISNTMSCVARPGLKEFLEFCRAAFPRIVVYTGVLEERFRELAGQLVDAAGALALNPRGTLYDEETIQEHRARRDLMDELRSSGMLTGGPSTLNKTHVQSFANSLDRILTRSTKGR